MSALERSFFIKYNYLKNKNEDSKKILAQITRGHLTPHIDCMNERIELCENYLYEQNDNFSIFQSAIAPYGNNPLPQNLKEIYTQIMQELGSIEYYQAINIDALLPFLKKWDYQKSDFALNNHHNMVSTYTKSLCQEIGIQTPVFVLLGEEFSSLPYQRLDKTLAGYVINITQTEFTRFERWSITAHELGHIYYDENPQIIKNINDPVIEEINRLTYGNVDINNEVLAVWIDKWIPELVSDLIAVRTLGPVFTRQILNDALGITPLNFLRENPSHPPWEIRLRLMKEISNKLNLKDYVTYNELITWEHYKTNFIHDKDPFLSILLDCSIVDLALELTQKHIVIEPISKLWSSILEAKLDINAKSTTLLSAISACSLETNEKSLETIKSVILEGSLS